MSNESKLTFELVTAPGVRRDGTEQDSPFHIAAQWVRWQRKRPRKMGGYRAIVQDVAGPVRAMHVDARNGFARAHLFSPFGIEQLAFNAVSGSGSVLTDRTPSGFVQNDLLTWQAAALYDSGGAGSNRLICAATPDLEAIDSDSTGFVYSADINGSGLFTKVQDGSGDIEVSGGCCVLQPFLFVYGSEGLLRNSNANDISAGTGWTTGGSSAANTVNVAGTKIVFGLPLRGGANSPAGVFWALDSLIRVSFVSNGVVNWSYDTVSSQISVMSKAGIVEFDGVYYWLGVDRFFMYTGVVQELPNEMNLNWLMDNLNPAYRNKVWAMKVPRFGEIWWFFPYGESTECNAAVIYNVREKTWYDSMLMRRAGTPAQTLLYPVMAGDEDARQTTRLQYTPNTGAFGVGDVVTGSTFGAFGTVVKVGNNSLNLDHVVGEFSSTDSLTNATASATGTVTAAPSSQPLDTVWQHEFGYDKIVGSNALAIEAYYQTRNFSLLDGGPSQEGSSGENKQTRLERVEPDFVQAKSMTMKVLGRRFAQSSLEESAPYPFNPDTSYISTREQRRLMSLEFRSNVIGGSFQAGKVLIMVAPGDERG